MDTQSLVTNKRKIKSTQLFVVAGAVLVTLVISVICVGLTVRYEVDSDIVDTESIQYWKMYLPQEQDVWYENGIEELRTIIMRKEEPAVKVENVIIFLAEGVNSEMLARSRFVEGDKVNAKDFIWDTFPYMGVLQNSCSNLENCDLFTLGTSLFGGVKTNQGLGGIDKRVEFQNCQQALNESYHIHSILRQAKDLNLRTGFVTTKRVTGPLVAALYAHSSNTHWECDADISDPKKECLDVAKQLIKSKDSNNINVIMGGGKQTLVSEVPISPRLIIDDTACNSMDKRNLLKDWKSSMLSQKLQFELLYSSNALNSFNGSSNDYVVGVFANGDISDHGPSLNTMTMKSLDVLHKKKTGYVFVAETAVKGEQVEDFQATLWELNDVIKETFKHPGFSPETTLVLTVFLNINPSANSPNAPNDILVYAQGPNSFLFHSVHEETYMAHAIMYSLQMGPFKPIKKSNNKLKTKL